jgi:hypothetical protein
MVATFLNQEIVMTEMCREADNRTKKEEQANTNYFARQLSEALTTAKKCRVNNTQS